MTRPKLEELIEAIRSDKIVGRGTCSVIDECFTDTELSELIFNCRTVGGAIKVARKYHKLWRDRERDILNA